MSCTVGFGKLFSQSSPNAPALLPLCHAAKASYGNSQKQLTKPTVQFILSLSIHSPNSLNHFS